MAAGISAAGWGFIAASLATQIYTSNQQQKSAGAAQQQARKSAEEQARLADEANGRANSKKADVSSILAAAQQNSLAGVSGTMLTGPQGVNANQLLLGKSTLLGG